MQIRLPEMLKIPPKMLATLLHFDKYNYHLSEGGRGGGKSHSVARILLFIGSKRKVRICCGRETQNSIADSVKTLFDDVIEKYNLDYEITKDKIVHRKTGTEIFFKGFREQGKVNIKGLEGIDILWIDEAQAITKPTLDFIIPTIRKKNSRVIFTMNRHTRFDPVYNFCVGREDTLHIYINYFDNPFLDEKQKKEAEICKAKNLAEYQHIWLGLPLAQAHDYLLSSDKIDEAKRIKFNDEAHPNNSVMSVDLSASGGDLCVAKLIVQKSITGWEEAQTVTWSEPDTDITKGKIINLYSKWQPNILILDADGLGYPIYVSVKKAIDGAIGFRGAQKPKGIGAGNQRADGYIALKDFIENGWLKLTCENSARQLEYLKRVYKPSGLTFIQDKKDIRKEQSESPDFADALMMGIYALTYHSHLLARKEIEEGRLNHRVVESDFDPFN